MDKRNPGLSCLHDKNKIQKLLAHGEYSIFKKWRVLVEGDFIPADLVPEKANCCKDQKSSPLRDIRSLALTRNWLIICQMSRIYQFEKDEVASSGTSIEIRRLVPVKYIKIYISSHRTRSVAIQNLLGVTKEYRFLGVTKCERTHSFECWIDVINSLSPNHTEAQLISTLSCFGRWSRCHKCKITIYDNQVPGQCKLMSLGPKELASNYDNLVDKQIGELLKDEEEYDFDSYEFVPEEPKEKLSKTGSDHKTQKNRSSSPSKSHDRTKSQPTGQTSLPKKNTQSKQKSGPVARHPRHPKSSDTHSHSPEMPLLSTSPQTTPTPRSHSPTSQQGSRSPQTTPTPRSRSPASAPSRSPKHRSPQPPPCQQPNSPQQPPCQRFQRTSQPKQCQRMRSSQASPCQCMQQRSPQPKQCRRMRSPQTPPCLQKSCPEAVLPCQPPPVGPHTHPHKSPEVQSLPKNTASHTSQPHVHTPCPQSEERHFTEKDMLDPFAESDIYTPPSEQPFFDDAPPVKAIPRPEIDVPKPPHPYPTGPPHHHPPKPPPHHSEAAHHYTKAPTYYHKPPYHHPESPSYHIDPHHAESFHHHPPDLEHHTGHTKHTYDKNEHEEDDETEEQYSDSEEELSGCEVSVGDSEPVHISTSESEQDGIEAVFGPSELSLPPEKKGSRKSSYSSRT